MLKNNKKRARTDDEKETRRRRILKEATAFISESGFDGVTMSGLATRANLAKGTLYLYFQTKEEVFLALFVEEMQVWIDLFVDQARAETIPDVMTQLSMDQPLFLPLYARLVSVIEANVSEVAFIAAKRSMMEGGARVASCIETLLDVPSHVALDAATALMVALQGAAQFDITTDHDPNSLPDDVRDYMAAHGFALQFPRAARMILAGISAGEEAGGGIG